MSAFPVQLECPTAHVTPGEPLRCRLRIYNPADAVDEYTVVGLDEAADWVATDPPRLALMPKTDGELQLIITIPTDAPVRAGDYRLLMQIQSSLDQTAAVTEDLFLQVAEVTRAELTITPPTDSSETHDITATLTVANYGNHPLDLQFDAIDRDHDLPLRITPWQRVVQPFHASTLPLTLPFGSCTAHGSHSHRIEVTATANNHLTTSEQTRIPHNPSITPQESPRSFGRWLWDTLKLFVIIPLGVILLLALEVLVTGAILSLYIFGRGRFDDWFALAAVAALVLTLVGAGLVAYHRGALHELRRTRNSGAIVDHALVNKAVWQIAGVLLLIPGFVTDLAGVVLALPKIRGTIGRKLSKP